MALDNNRRGWMMTLFGTYQKNGRWIIEEIKVLKETDKRITVERAPVTGFKATLDKQHDGFIVQATTREKAILFRRQALQENIRNVQHRLKEAEQELINFERDME
jgi:hypothetical protein